MNDDEFLRARPLLERPGLDSFGVAELRDYVAALQAEIARAEASIARKTDHRGAAEAVFGPR